MHLKLILIAMLVVAVNSLRTEKRTSRLDEKWTQFKVKYGKTYSPREEVYRKSTWLTNLEYITSHNSEAKLGKHSYFLKMNQFGDMKSKEFYRKIVLQEEQRVSLDTESERLSKDIPNSVDWRNKSCIFPVRDFNEACNDMYAIDSADGIAGMICAQSSSSSKLVELSAQQILDCSKASGNLGCDGGSTWNTYSYVKQYGLESSDAYPLVHKDQDCRFNSKLVTARISDYKAVKFGDETTLTSVLAAYGPVPTFIDASNPSFQFYSSGVYYDSGCDPNQVDHMMLLVGYGTQGANSDYYIAKNSWGVEWGMQGYINLSRNRDNNCGVASFVSYPIVSV